VINSRGNRLTFRCGFPSHSDLAGALANFPRILRDCSGSQVAEFALCSTLLTMFFFGLMQCCLAFYQYNFVSGVARLGARYAVVRGSACSGMPDCGITQAQIQTYLRGKVFPGINSSNLTASVKWLQASTSHPTTWSACTGQCNDPGNAVQVQVKYAFPLNIPFWGSKSLAVTSTSQMVISQ
jgi:Flp pilus assembly protein TadG